MPIVKEFTQEKKEVGTVELSSDVFDVAIKPEIVHFVVRAIRASRRSGTHATKTRSKVSGGGAKPWKQKGTGRARAGSNRSPLWKGGAIIFGPQPRSYAFKVNKKIRALALKMALTSYVKEEKLIVLDKFSLMDYSTASFRKVMELFSMPSALVIDAQHNDILLRSSSNLSKYHYVTYQQLNVYDMLKYEYLVLLKDAVSLLHKRFEE